MLLLDHVILEAQDPRRRAVVLSERLVYTSDGSGHLYSVLLLGHVILEAQDRRKRAVVLIERLVYCREKYRKLLGVVAPNAMDT